MGRGGHGAQRRTRREVLRQGAAVVASAGLAPGVALGTGAGVGRRGPVRIGVVGGGFGCSFWWHAHPDCEVTAVSDLRPDRRARLPDGNRIGRRRLPRPARPARRAGAAGRRSSGAAAAHRASGVPEADRVVAQRFGVKRLYSE